MREILIVIGCVLYYAFGVWSHIHWWTKEIDFRVYNIVVALIVGVMGPFAYLVGFFIHGDWTGGKILIKKK